MGEAAALEFAGFLDIYKEIATLEDILLNPLGARLPDADKPATATAMVSMLAGRVTASNFDQIMLYVNRMIAADMREFVGFFIQDAMTRDPRSSRPARFSVNRGRASFARSSAASSRRSDGFPPFPALIARVFPLREHARLPFHFCFIHLFFPESHYVQKHC